MKITELENVNEGVKDWVKARGRGMGTKAAAMLGAVPAAVGSALGMDPNRPGVEKAKVGLAKANFAGVFSEKMTGMLFGQVASIKKRMAAVQAQEPAAPAAPAAPTSSSIILPGDPRYAMRESLDYKLRVALKEDAAQAEELRQQLINWLINTVNNYMSGVDVSGIQNEITQYCTTALDNALAGRSDRSFLELGKLLFDQYDNSIRQQVQQTNPYTQVKLSTSGQQALQTMEKLTPEERDTIYQKLKNVP
jgi:hypothetical protein